MKNAQVSVPFEQAIYAIQFIYQQNVKANRRMNKQNKLDAKSNANLIQLTPRCDTLNPTSIPMPAAE